MVKTEPTGRKEKMAAKRDTLHRVVAMFENVNDLSKQQSAVIKSSTSGRDTFVSLPTGHGKSFIYQLAIIPYEKEYSVRPGFESVSWQHREHAR